MRWFAIGGKLASRFRQSAQLRALRAALEPINALPADRTDATIAVECVEDPLFFALFGAICATVRRSQRARVELVVVRAANGAVGTGFPQSVARSAVFALFASMPWISVYRGIADGIAYRCQSLTRPLSDAFYWLRSWVVWRTLQADPTTPMFHVKGVPVGDLIVDSYLRFRPAPRFDSRDRFVRFLLWQAYRHISRARSYFKSRKPALYLTTYSTYLEHGIPIRVALEEGVSVFSFGSLSQFGKRLTVGDWFHTRDSGHYRRDFESLDGQAERLAAAERALLVRLRGGIDPAMTYMRVSAYAASSEPLPDVTGATIVFLHDFYDSPHVFPEFIFPDFWSWICFTIDVLRDSGATFYLKPHPNQIALSGAVLDQLRMRYAGLPMLASGVSNAQLAEAGIVRGVTAYGSVAHELAYFGIPTVTCARHPHHSFGFCATAHDLRSYERLLRDTDSQRVDPEDMRRQALAFYYMHNLHGDSSELELRNHFATLWQACHDPRATSARLASLLQTMRSMPAFRAFCSDLCRSLPSTHERHRP